MPKLLIAGGTGLIGSNVIKKLKQKNYEVVLLSTQKSKPNNVDTFYWNPERDLFPLLDLTSIDACINFCGAPIFDKGFTEDRKRELTRSRLLPIEFLAKQFKKAACELPIFISTSATGFYPNICLTELDEDSTSGDWFLSDLVRQWEQAVDAFSGIAKKRCIIRTGIVLSKEGGFLAQLAKPIRYFVGAVPGPGTQMISWIHEDDMADLVIWAFENKLDGIYNAAAPEPESLANITKQTANVLGRPLIMPNIPVWALKLIFGLERHKLLLTSQKVSSRKIESTGFRFNYHSSRQAIENLLKK